MCGILAVFGALLDEKKARAHVAALAGRGPEGARILAGQRFQLGFTRLAINGLNEAGMQPFGHNNLQFICNGEIYNHRDLEERYNILAPSGSDCQMLGPLFEKLATSTDAATFFRALDGVFALVMVDNQNDVAYVARDPYGVRPLFIGYQFIEIEGRQTLARLSFASEMKALPSCSHVEAFPPGHYAAYDLKSLNRIGYEAYHTVPWLKRPSLQDSDTENYSKHVSEPIHATSSEFAISNHLRGLIPNSDSKLLCQSLEAAVEKRVLNTERPIAALLSGGLDSSLIAALVQRKLKEMGKPALKTFSIGFQGSEDLRCARIAADHIGSDHTEVLMTPNEFFDAIPQVIKDIETFDITTVRASVGNYLVSQYIAKHTDCKVVFNGDGSDEVFGGYLYFKKAPSDEAFEYECRRLLNEIHTFDVLRSDRSISSHGLEARTPFLDKQFVAVAMSIPTHLRRPTANRMEKMILREAFLYENLLPKEILLRRKEAFSDGVSGTGDGAKSWYQECQERSLEEVGDDWAQKAAKFVYMPPQTPEAYYYRFLFDKYYKGYELAVVPHYWMPQWTNATDPSARTLAIYTDHTDAAS